MANTEERFAAQDVFFLSVQCPMVSVDEIAGLVQTIAHNSSDDKINLTVLGKSVGHDEQRLLAVLDLLEKLGLAKLITGRAELTPVGSRYARASGHTRRLIFADQLALSVPLVKSVQSKVAAHPKREVHLAQIAADLRHRDPSSAIDRTLRQLIDWARYAGLLHYDDQTGLVSLPGHNERG